MKIKWRRTCTTFCSHGQARVPQRLFFESGFDKPSEIESAQGLTSKNNRTLCGAQTCLSAGSQKVRKPRRRQKVALSADTACCKTLCHGYRSEPRISEPPAELLGSSGFDRRQLDKVHHVPMETWVLKFATMLRQSATQLGEEVCKPMKRGSH